jgi:hypothetical protein
MQTTAIVSSSVRARNVCAAGDVDTHGNTGCFLVVPS